MARQAVSQRLHQVLDLERQNTIPDRKHYHRAEAESSSDLAPGRRFELRTLRVTDRCRPFKNGAPNSPRAVRCQQVARVATGVGVRTASGYRATANGFGFSGPSTGPGVSRRTLRPPLGSRRSYRPLSAGPNLRPAASSVRGYGEAPP